MSSASLLSKALVAAVTIVSAGCAGRNSINVMATPAVAATELAPVPENAQPAQSIFDLKSYWHSQDGITARLATLNGGLLLVGVANLNGDAASDITVAAMKNIERITDPTVHLVLVTLGAERASPEIMAAFANARGLSTSRWTLIGSNVDATRELATVLNVRNRKYTAAELADASMLTVIDANGVPVQQQGAGDVALIAEALELLLAIGR